VPARRCQRRIVSGVDQQPRLLAPRFRYHIGQGSQEGPVRLLPAQAGQAIDVPGQGVHGLASRWIHLRRMHSQMLRCSGRARPASGRPACSSPRAGGIRPGSRTAVPAYGSARTRWPGCQPGGTHTRCARPAGADPERGITVLVLAADAAGHVQENAHNRLLTGQDRQREAAPPGCWPESCLFTRTVAWSRPGRWLCWQDSREAIRTSAGMVFPSLNCPRPRW
jgi:hypothetical protein